MLWFVAMFVEMFSFSLVHYDRLQEMVLKEFFGHILKGLMFAEPKKQNIKPMFFQAQQNLSFQNQLKDYAYMYLASLLKEFL